MADPGWPTVVDAAAEYDGVGRKQPHRLNAVHFARAIPGYISQFTGRVPDQFSAQVADGVVEVACPCGVTPTPRCDRWVPTACVCGRTFLFTGREVRVAYHGIPEARS